MVETRPSSNEFKDIQNAQLIKVIYGFETYRGNLKQHLHNGCFLQGKITLEDHNMIDKLISSSDEESVFLGELAIKQRIS